jgi:hypothetical protein
MIKKTKVNKVTLQVIADAWGVSKVAVHKWVKMGCPTTSIEAATKWRDEYLQASGKAAPATLNEARLEKTLLESERIRVRLQQDRGELVEIAVVREAGIRIGAIFSAKLAALVNDASGALAGLDEATLRKKLHERTQSILAEIRTELEKV